MSIMQWSARDDDISTRLFWTAEYFRGCAMLGGIGLAIYLVSAAFATQSAAGAAMHAHPFASAGGLILSIATLAGWYLTGEALHARRRIGGWLALTTMLPPILRAIGTHGRPGLGLAIPVLGTLAILTSWRELD